MEVELEREYLPSESVLERIERSNGDLVDGLCEHAHNAALKIQEVLGNRAVRDSLGKWNAFLLEEVARDMLIIIRAIDGGLPSVDDYLSIS